MAILQVQNLSKSFGEELLFAGVSFQLEPGEKVALVGQNGTGKSTLLKCILGIEEYDEGAITVGKNAYISYLAQRLEDELLEQSLIDFLLIEYEDLIRARNQMKSLEKEMSLPEIYNDEVKLNQVMKDYSKYTAAYESGGGYTFESKIKEMIFGLGFLEEDLERNMGSFSGGQKTRLYLARLLLREPDVLLLDEPTNYLDLQQIAWLEKFFNAYNGTLLVVSHDRYFLDKVVNRVLELSNHTLFDYPGNYSAYILQKTLKEDTLEKENMKLKEKIKRLEEYIRRNKAGVNASQARGREKQLKKLGSVQKLEKAQTFSFAFQQDFLSGDDVLTIKDLSVYFGEKNIFKNLSFNLERGDRVGLVGPNGCGKSTLLKAILKQIPYEGSIRQGSNLKIAYFAQEHETLGQEGTILEELIKKSSLTIQEIRDLLARFQFRGEDIYKKLSDLSGGEKSRLILAKLFNEKANFLILDEPTNHLDLYARQTLEDSLTEFPGTILFVSHDRYFLNTISSKIIELENSQLTEYIGDYEYYIWKKENTEHYANLKKLNAKKEQEIIKKEDKKKNNPKNNLGKLEKQIMEAEDKLKEITASLGDSEIYSDPEQVAALQKEYTVVESELELLYAEWEKLIEEHDE